ncbi:MAG: DUF554 domain-containing protein [Anaerolineae bacterium]
MTGTFINVGTVLLGSLLGITLGSRLSESMRETVLRGLGLVTLIIGVDMALPAANILIPLASLLDGGILGEMLDIEGALNRLGGWLEERFTQGEDEAGSNRFIQGFVTASLLFCVGPLTIIGSIQDGLSGDATILTVKAMLDGFASLAFASTLGIGVAFSALTVLVVQGGISLLAGVASAILTEPMITELSATGGMLIVGLSVSSLLQITPIRVGNFLPALLIAPLIVAALTALGLPVAPQF